MPPGHGNKPHGAIRKNLPHKSGFHKPHWVERLEVSVSGRLQNYRTADCRLSQYSLRHHHTTACLSPVAYAEIETYLRRYLCFCFRSGEGRCEVAHRVKIFWVLARRFALDGACLEVSSSPAMTINASRNSTGRWFVERPCQESCLKLPLCRDCSVSFCF